MQWCCAKLECSSSRDLQLLTFPIPIWDLHLWEAPFTAWKCHVQRFSCRITATVSFGFSAACLSDHSMQLFIQEFCQIFWCLLNYRWNLAFYESWPTLKACFCLKIFALLLQLTARLLKLEINRRSKFPLFSVSLLCICDNTFTQIRCFPWKTICKVNFLLSVEFL